MTGQDIIQKPVGEESAEYVYRNQAESAKAKEKNVGVRTQYVYSAARYHAGIASAEELMEALFQICEGGDLSSSMVEAPPLEREAYLVFPRQRRTNARVSGLVSSS